MKSSSVSFRCEVISNNKIAPDYYKMTLGVGAVSKKVKPGQFFNIRCSNGASPLLRRPFSVHRILDGKGVEILYEVVGKATGLLSGKRPGDLLAVIGPLGNGFPLRNMQSAIRNTVLVAGGIGVAPLLALAERISRLTVNGLRLTVIGAKTKNELLCEKEFKKLGFKVLLSTEDGSKGKKGFVTDLLYTIHYTPYTILYACGPHPMLKEVAKIARLKRAEAFGCFEEHMACGVGSCYGCVIKTKQGYERVCKDGPIFDLKEIVW